MNLMQYQQLLQKAVEHGRLSMAQAQAFFALYQEDPSVAERSLSGALSSPKIEESAQAETRTGMEHEKISKKMLRAGGIQIGTTIGPFTLLKLLGQGGMGAVYLAQQKSPNRRVAVKLMTHLGSRDKVQIKRFLREAELTASFDHPNIVKVYLAGIEEDIPYLAMECIEGAPLPRYLDENPCDLPEKLRLIGPIARALHYAHEKKIVHRDIKPSNIMVTSAGIPMLMDFGIARGVRVHDKRLTRTGEILGTPRYMSPEQTRGERDLDGRTDIYSLGAVLYEILTGTPLYSGETDLEVMYRVASEMPVIPRQIDSKISEDMESIVLKCLEKNKKRRYETADALAEDIQCCLDGKPVQANRKNNLRRLRWGIVSHRKPLCAAAALLLLSCGILCAILWPLTTQESEGNLGSRGPSSDEISEETIVARLEQKPTLPLYNGYISFLEKSGCHDVAAEKCEEAIRRIPTLSPKERENLRRRRAENFLKLSRYPEAYAAYEEIQEKISQDILRFAQCAFELEKYAEVSEILEKFRPSSHDQECRYFFYKGAASLKRFLGEMQGYRRLDILSDMVQGKNPISEKKLLEEALSWLKEAKSKWESQPEEEKGKESLENSRIQAFLGYAWVWALDFEKALQFLGPMADSPSRAKEADLVMAYEGLGLVAFSQKRYEQAIQYFSVCVDRRPWESHYYFYRAKSCMQTKGRSLEKLVDDCMTSLEITPANLLPIDLLIQDIIENHEPKEILNTLYMLFIAVKAVLSRIDADLWGTQFREMASHYLREGREEKEGRSFPSQKIDELIQQALERESKAALEMGKRILSTLPQRAEILSKLKEKYRRLAQEKKDAQKARAEEIMNAVEAAEKKAQKKRLKGWMARLLVARDATVKPAITPEHVVWLEEMLQDPQEPPLLRHWAAETLMAIRRPDAYLVLERSCRGKELSTRILATAALQKAEFEAKQGRISFERLNTLGPEILSIFFHSLGDDIDENEGVRQEKIALATLFLDHENEKVRVSAARVCLRKGRKEGIEAMKKAVKSTQEEVRAYAHCWLWDSELSRHPSLQDELIERKSLELLKEALAHEKKTWVRSVIAASVEKLVRVVATEKMEKAIEELLPLLKKRCEPQQEPESAVRFRIVQALVGMNQMEFLMERISSSEDTLANRVVPLYRMFSGHSYAATRISKGPGTSLKIVNFFLRQDVFEKLPPVVRCFFFILSGKVGERQLNAMPGSIGHRLFITPIENGLFSPREETQRMAAYGAVGLCEGHESLRKKLRQKYESNGSLPPLIRQNIVSALTHGALQSLLKGKPEFFKSLDASWEKEFPEAVAYAYYRFMEKAYHDRLDERQFQGASQWGRDQTYLLQREATLNNMARELFEKNKFKELVGHAHKYVSWMDPALLKESPNFIRLAQEAYDIVKTGSPETLSPAQEKTLRRYFLGHACWRLLQLIEKARALDGRSAPYHFEAALIWEFIGEWEKASEAVEKAMKLDPSRMIYRFVQARLLLSQGGGEGVRKACDILEALSSQGNSSYALAGLLGKTYMAMGKWEKAKEAFFHQHLLFPYQGEPLVYLANAFLSLNDISSAQHRLNQAEAYIIRERDKIKDAYREKDDMGDAFFPNVYIFRAIAMRLFVSARYRARLKGNGEKIVGEMKKGMALCDGYLSNYPDSPFTRENLSNYPELRPFRDAVPDMPVRIQGLTATPP